MSLTWTLHLVACWAVMQFGGQHPGGIGVPTVGMAFPGYVAQPQGLGLGSSEMTWYTLFYIISVQLSYLDVLSYFRNYVLLDFMFK